MGPTIDALFPSYVKVIAEPGRFFVSSAYTLAVNILSRRVVSAETGHIAQDEADKTESSFMYYINDGVYGSFNCIMFDHYQPTPNVLFRDDTFTYRQAHGLQPKPCSIWGPTCDSMDCITKFNDALPEMNVGDWLYFDHMGAYTMAAASQFNGFLKSRILYTNTERV